MTFFFGQEHTSFIYFKKHPSFICPQLPAWLMMVLVQHTFFKCILQHALLARPARKNIFFRRHSLYLCDLLEK